MDNQSLEELYVLRDSFHNSDKDPNELQRVLLGIAMREADFDWQQLHYSIITSKNEHEQMAEFFDVENHLTMEEILNSKNMTNNVMDQLQRVTEGFLSYEEFVSISEKYNRRGNALRELEKVAKKARESENPSSTVASALLETDSSLDPSSFQPDDLQRGDDDQSNERESVTENVEKIQSDSKNCMGCDESVCDNTNAGNGQKGYRGLEEVQNEAGDTCPAPDPITGRTPKVFVERAKDDWKMELFVALAAGFVVALLIKEDKYGV